MNEEEPADVARQRRVIQINRPTYSQKEFDVEFELNEADTKKRDSIPKRIRSYAKSLDPLGFFSIINLFAEYNFKSFLLADFLSGFTVGIMNIPQALAYGALTSLNPVNGLYTSFYCGLGYVLFGTSKHLSVGTFAVVSLMVYSTIMQVETEYQPRRASEETFAQINLSSLNSSGDDQFDMMRVNTTLMKTFELDTQGMRVKIAASLAFWCGFIQILFSALGLGRISKYMPQSLLRAFTTGAAFHVLSSQVRHVFGIYYVHKKRRKILKLFFIYYRILQNINLINWVAFITSVGSIILLLLVKTQINDRFKKQLRNIPLPIELVVIVIGIVVTYFAQLDQKYDLAIIGKIPQGLPEPSLPDFSLFFYVIKDAIIISVIAFTTSVSVSDLYARKHKYRINSNKEFLALGVANIIGSFFKSFTSCGSLARSAVQESSGGKTQMSTIVSSFVVLAVMLWLSPLLETLPKAILAAIIIAALVNLLKQLRDIPYYWRVDKLDCLTWVITFAGTVLLDVDYGLGIGVITVLFINTYRSQNLELKVVGQVKDYEIFSDVKNYQVNLEQSYKIIRPNHSIFYINSDLFGDTLNTIFPLKDAQTTRPTVCENCKTNYKCLSKCCRKAEEDENANEANKALNQTIRPTALILDCSNLTFIDDSGFKSLSKCIKDYQNDGVRFILTNCHENILKFFANMKFAHEDVFMTIRDALETLK